VRGTDWKGGEAAGTGRTADKGRNTTGGGPDRRRRYTTGTRGGPNRMEGTTGGVPNRMDHGQHRPTDNQVEAGLELVERSPPVDAQ